MVRGAGVQRAGFVDGEISLGYACAQSARAEARKSRREWIVRTGSAPADLPMWTSRDGWLTDLAALLATDEGLAGCARVHIKPELVLRVARCKAAHADHATGRNCAASNATVAAAADCSTRTVTNVNGVLSGLGVAVEAHRGTGSASTPGYGRRPSIWHLISRRQPVDKPAAGTAVCDLPPSRRDRRVSPVRSQSPNARTRASRSNSHPPKSSPKRGRRYAPRPLHVQLLAAGVIAGSHGLDRGHIGRICDALTESGLELDVWTAPQLLAALNADMKARGWSWPDRVDHPASFLRSRLRRLPVRPAGAHQGGVTAARPDSRKSRVSQDRDGESRQSTEELTQRWYADVIAVTTPQERQTLLRAHAVKFGTVVDPFAALAGAGRRAAREYPQLPLAAGLMQWARDELGEEPCGGVRERVPSATSLSTDLLMDLAIGKCDCIVCGAPNALERPQLPLRAMSTVCDQCWPVIAAELAEASAIDEEMLA
ncbi:hypothetical protein KL953_34170 [Mycolicibacterium goodii]|uniref:hypothetical protein n=1 Tax=Mycolicibacterium goodii TaxID=134601 RepID=UPI001BDC61FE|nr:hypothetical protein [Mycolicibacterium goodii]MBU8813912.1 hypothetical protein [Mycolicibacterium goodii]